MKTAFKYKMKVVTASGATVRTFRSQLAAEECVRRLLFKPEVLTVYLDRYDANTNSLDSHLGRWWKPH